MVDILSKPAAIATKPSTPKQDRATEAKNLIVKTKSQLTAYTNMKGSVKAEVIISLDRLYALVKEAENARKAAELNGKANATVIISGKSQRPDCTTRIKSPQMDQLIVHMEQHAELLKENSKLWPN